MEKKHAIIIPACTLALGAYWLYYSLVEYEFYDQTGPLTGFFPAIVAVLMIVGSLVLLIRPSDDKKAEFHVLQLLPVLGGIFIAAVGYVFGTIPAIFIFLLAWLRGFERYSLKFSLMVSGIVTLAIWLIFDIGVSVYFQPGAIKEWF